TAVRLMEAVSYRNAGTVEFVYDQQTQQFYFLEVNTRLQVEHGVTEQVYGVDLVQWMLQLASGDMLALPVVPKPKGHAIQVRVYAEGPHNDFQPCAGLLTQVGFPKPESFPKADLRIDHWIERGVEISPLFDPMLAKMIITAKDRESARQQLDLALALTQIHGIETNIP